jgi:NTE family protein
MLLAAAGPALAQTGTDAKRPKVGLVLGGGGARGGAHLGVLEVLEDLRVPVDCVAGTSMGALVGGAFVAGVAPADMRETIGKTDWSTLFDDSAGRELLNLRLKRIDDRFFSGLEFGITDDGLRYREGAVAGEKIKLFFNELVRADLGERNIEELPLPLTLIATDIGTGARVAMRTGNLTSAMRASMSVPGAMAPIIREDRKLVDGGLVDNVPVQEVRDRCGAEVVIAVNVGSPLLKPDEVSGIISVVGQMVNLLTEQNVAHSLALLGPRDIYMRPELGDITAASFTRQLEAAAIGRATALAQADKLSALSVSPAEYAVWRTRMRLAPNVKPPLIAQVQISGTRYVNSEELRGNIRQREGEPLNIKELNDDLVLAYSRGDLQSLDYSVLPEREKAMLRITPVEKAWGPNYLRFGLNLSSTLHSDADYNVRALYRKTWLNSYGAEWLSALQIGSNQRFGTELYQPLDYRQFWFVRPSVSFDSRDASLYFDGSRLAEYRLDETRLAIDFGVNLGTYGQAAAGWRERRVKSTLSTGSPVLPNAKVQVGGVGASLAIDKYDFAFFPSRGYKADLDYFDALRGDDEDRYGRVQGAAGFATSAGRFIFLGRAEGGTATHGQLPISDLFSLGGSGRLSAFAPGQIVGDEYWLGTMQLQYRLTQPMPLLGLSLIAGVSLEAARMRHPITEPKLTGTLQSYGAYLATNTPLGPIYLGYADTPGRKGRFYFFVGTP